MRRIKTELSISREGMKEPLWVGWDMGSWGIWREQFVNYSAGKITEKDLFHPSLIDVNI